MRPKMTYALKRTSRSWFPGPNRNCVWRMYSGSSLRTVKMGGWGTWKRNRDPGRQRRLSRRAGSQGKWKKMDWLSGNSPAFGVWHSWRRSHPAAGNCHRSPLHIKMINKERNPKWVSSGKKLEVRRVVLYSKENNMHRVRYFWNKRRGWEQKDNGRPSRNEWF